MGVTKIYSIMPDFTLQKLQEEFQAEKAKARCFCAGKRHQ